MIFCVLCEFGGRDSGVSIVILIDQFLVTVFPVNVWTLSRLAIFFEVMVHTKYSMLMEVVELMTDLRLDG